MKIKNSVVLVTGANRGLGLAFAKALVARGARKVYAGARDPGSLETISGVTPISLDVNDPASLARVAALCNDVNLLVNNAGIATLLQGPLDPALINVSRAMLETNYFGVVRTTQALVPMIVANGGAVLNVLSDHTWIAHPVLAAYAPSKSAAWSFTNALRTELRDKHVQVLGLHVGYLDTDMTRGLDLKKSDPRAVVELALDALEAGEEEVLADDGTRAIKRSLSSAVPFYLVPMQAA